MSAQLLSSAIELIANRALTLSSQPVDFADKYQGKSLAVTLTELSFTLQFQYLAPKLLVTSPEQSDADCTVITSLSTLNEIRSEHQLTELIKADKLDITGDIKIAQQFAALAESIDIDWPTALEAHIGDVTTYKLTSIGRKLADKLRFAKTQITSDASEYLIHEQRLVVTPAEMTRFSSGVQQSQSHLNQLEQRINALATRLAEQAQ